MRRLLEPNPALTIVISFPSFSHLCGIKPNPVQTVLNMKGNYLGSGGGVLCLDPRRGSAGVCLALLLGDGLRPPATMLFD